ncbi:hypothetical protein KHU50_006438 [Colletotrichum sp. SAR 10_65]|nr:hypothetical protein KHU50_006438 [Colletotrichum sp. SAR 10_65]KAI8223443.1 hypothetical protein K4K53_006907 [Colletotrichum sp. SAR 10_77]
MEGADPNEWGPSEMEKLSEKMTMTSLFSSPEHEDCVTLKAGGKSFTSKKSILIKNSEYFATCFKNKNFVEGKTMTVEFDDIDPELLAIYLHLATMQAIKVTVQFDPALMEEPKRLKPMVDLYEVADRFMNSKMAGLLGRAILEMAMDHPVYRYPRDMTDRERSWCIENYKEAFEALGDGDEARRYMREVLAAAYCRWIPLGNFRRDISPLWDAPDFSRELMICFATLLDDLQKSKPTGYPRDRIGIDLGWAFLKPSFQTSVTIKCGDKTFIFNKAILTQHSEYFDACLKVNAFAEGRTSTITFDDIEPEHMGCYLHLLYCTSADKHLVRQHISSLGTRKNIAFLVQMWQIADRFISGDLCERIAAEILQVGHVPFLFIPKDKTDEQRAAWIKNVKGAFEAWNQQVPNQLDLRDRMLGNFAKKFPMEHLPSALNHIEPNSIFMRELCKAITHRALDLQARVSELETKVTELGGDVEEKAVGLFGSTTR